MAISKDSRRASSEEAQRSGWHHQQTVSPTEVKDRIAEALRRTAELDASRISVDVGGSTVKLFGSVRSWAERGGRASRVVRTWDRKKVENHLTINP